MRHRCTQALRMQINIGILIGIPSVRAQSSMVVAVNEGPQARPAGVTEVQSWRQVTAFSTERGWG